MEGQEIYEAIKAAILDASKEQHRPPQGPMMPIEPFDAEDEVGDPLRVVGVIDMPDDMKFVVIEESDDGEIRPFPCSAVYRKGTAGEDAA